MRDITMMSAPWQKEGYTGKLKMTPKLPTQPGFIEKRITQDEEIELLYELFSIGCLNEDSLNKQISKTYAANSGTTQRDRD